MRLMRLMKNRFARIFKNIYIALVFFNGKESAKSNRSEYNFAYFVCDFNCIVLEAFRTLKNVFSREYASNACVLKQTVIQNIV